MEGSGQAASERLANIDQLPPVVRPYLPAIIHVTHVSVDCALICDTRFVNSCYFKSSQAQSVSSAARIINNVEKAPGVSRAFD